MPKKIIIFSLAGLAVILAAGVAVSKLTVHDALSVDADFRRKIMAEVDRYYDNFFERLALRMGQSRVLAAGPLSAEVESFTIFHIPLGYLRGVPGAKVSIFFNPASDWKTVNSTNGDRPLINY